MYAGGQFTVNSDRKLEKKSCGSSRDGRKL